MSFCTYAMRTSSWQYGQDFVDIGPTPRQFWVEPFEPKGQPIVCNGVETHVFTRWLQLVDFYYANGTVSLQTRLRINEWLSKRPWTRMVGYPGYFHIGDIQDATDPYGGVTMEGRSTPGFRYRVTYEQGRWTCTCAHWHRHRDTCCKHINACIDVSLVDMGQPKRLSWSMDSHSYDVGRVRPDTYPGVRDMVELVAAAAAVPTPVDDTAAAAVKCGKLYF